MIDELVDRDPLEQLESAGHIVVGNSGDDVVVRPAHPLFGDVVRSSLPELRRRRLMQALANLLEHQGAASRDDIIRLALWRLDGGGAATPELLLVAARQAHLAFDGTTAERLARAAWAADRGFEAAQVLADVLLARAGSWRLSPEGIVELIRSPRARSRRHPNRPFCRRATRPYEAPRSSQREITRPKCAIGADRAARERPERARPVTPVTPGDSKSNVGAHALSAGARRRFRGPTAVGRQVAACLD
jgi:hypothetical protein